MKKVSAPLILGIIVTAIATYFINQKSLEGAKLGGEGISKAITIRANLLPDEVAKELLPTSLLMGCGVGFVVFLVSLGLMSISLKPEKTATDSPS